MANLVDGAASDRIAWSLIGIRYWSGTLNPRGLYFLLALPLIGCVTGCFVPLKAAESNPFDQEKLSFIEIGKSTKDDVSAAMSNFVRTTDEGENRENLTPQIYRDGDSWLYGVARREFQYRIIAPELPDFGDIDYRFLLVEFDTDDTVIGYELSSSEGYGCNRSGICASRERHALLASEEEDRLAKQFGAFDDSCAVYVYSSNSPFMPVLLDADPTLQLLREEQFYLLRLDQGLHELSTGSTNWGEDSVEFDCLPGERYFFDVQAISKGFWNPRHWVVVDQKDAVTAQEEIAKRRLTLNLAESHD